MPEQDRGGQEQSAFDQLDWAESWYAAWESVMELGACDYFGGVEYLRVTQEAMTEGIPNCQTSMRRFIMERANVSPRGSITQASLARRQEKREKREKGENHGG